MHIEFNYEAEYRYLHELSEASHGNQEKTATAAEAGACAILPSEDGMHIYTALCANGVCVCIL